MDRTQSLGKDLPARLMTGAVGIPLILLFTYLGGPFFAIGVQLAIAIAGAELAQMIRPGLRRLQIFMILVVLLLCNTLAMHQVAPLLLAALLFILLSLWDRTPRLYGAGLLGAAYIGIGGGLMILLRGGEQGLAWVLLLFISNWTTDSFALLGGRLYGRHKLAPRISPGKTVEGALTGLFMGFLAGSLAALLLNLPLPGALLANLLIASSTQGGDLLESLLKRQLRVKDSGTILPGHGGLLDRIDGLLLAAPCLYLLLLLPGF